MHSTLIEICYYYIQYYLIFIAIIICAPVLNFQDSNIKGQPLVSGVIFNCINNKRSINSLLYYGDNGSIQNVSHNYVQCSQLINMDFNPENNSPPINEQARYQNRVRISIPRVYIERIIFLDTTKVIVNVFIKNMYILIVP